jgi:mono/diheme cytochrome c family protein
MKFARHSVRAMALVTACVLALPMVASAEAPPSATPRSAEKVYASSCGYCHGRNVGPVILGRGLPAPAIEAIVRNGLNAMPAFRPSEISDAELAAVAAWVSVSAANLQEHGK